MNSRGSWEGISNASPAGSSCCVYELLCKTDFSLRMLISSWLSSLCEAITLPKPQAPNLFSFNTTLHTGKNTASVRLNDWLQIWNGSHDDYCTRTPQERGVPLALRAWHRQTTSPRCLTGAGSRSFLDPQRGHWTGYHALWSHTLSPADRKDACLLSLTRCWQVPLTAMWSPGGSCHEEQSPPITEYTVLIPTTHFTPINNTGNLFPEDVFIAFAAKINLNMTNKFKRGFIMWPIISRAYLSCLGCVKSLAIWLDVEKNWIGPFCIRSLIILLNYKRGPIPKHMTEKWNPVCACTCEHSVKPYKDLLVICEYSG